MPADLSNEPPDREWFCERPRLYADGGWWRTPVIAVRFGRYWMVDVGVGPWSWTFGYLEMF